MRHATLVFLALLGFETAYANTDTDKDMKDVILEKRLGELSLQAPRNQTSTCLITHTHAQIKDVMANVTKWIDEAAKADFTTAYHFVAQVPSVEIFAYRDVEGKKEKVLLFEDHSTAKTRNGEAAQALIQLVDKVCGKK